MTATEILALHVLSRLRKPFVYSAFTSWWILVSLLFWSWWKVEHVFLWNLSVYLQCNDLAGVLISMFLIFRILFHYFKCRQILYASFLITILLFLLLLFRLCLLFLFFWLCGFVFFKQIVIKVEFGGHRMWFDVSFYLLEEVNVCYFLDLFCFLLFLFMDVILFLFMDVIILFLFVDVIILFDFNFMGVIFFLTLLLLIKVFVV